ncbi:activator of HSP90 ATPase [Streptomyces daqingensis]|uniref:Activator of HSP90 ATPase n=1 Tax=Streptomyces daqingensis TaxID=1472640 RepID=A0ABQ2MSX2_9ACTN|nr:SRPBCC domain-containing protein [Streptomyces daqingensis]GGO57212.1 activator of HSP90 ATPase [Streptomyces daqingensis]
MKEIVSQIDLVERHVGSRTVADGEARTVRLRRTYDAPVDDVWHACTDPARLSRWLMPVSGDLEPGGTYRLEGGASGEVLHCEPPRLLRVGWTFGDAPEFSEVEVRLAPEGEERTLFELEQAAVVPPEVWDPFGPGAFGVQWDLTALGLALELGGGPAGDLAAWRQESDEAREFMTRSSEAWGAAYAASGGSAEAVAAAVRTTTGFYVPQPDEGAGPS